MRGGVVSGGAAIGGSGGGGQPQAVWHPGGSSQGPPGSRAQEAMCSQHPSKCDALSVVRCTQRPLAVAGQQRSQCAHALFAEHASGMQACQRLRFTSTCLTTALTRVMQGSDAASRCAREVSLQAKWQHVASVNPLYCSFPPSSFPHDVAFQTIHSISDPSDMPKLPGAPGQRVVAMPRAAAAPLGRGQPPTDRHAAPVMPRADLPSIPFSHLFYYNQQLKQPCAPHRSVGGHAPPPASS